MAWNIDFKSEVEEEIKQEEPWDYLSSLSFSGMEDGDYNLDMDFMGITPSEDDEDVPLTKLCSPRNTSQQQSPAASAVSFSVTDDDEDVVAAASPPPPPVRHTRRPRRIVASTRSSRRQECNERERMRMHELNSAFHELRNVLPKKSPRANRRLTKKETLVQAKACIKALTNLACCMGGGDPFYSFIPGEDSSACQVAEIGRVFMANQDRSAQKRLEKTRRALQG